MLPAYRIRTPRLVLRCLEPADAERRKEAFDQSADHLAKLYPAPKEGPLTVEQHAERVRRMRGMFDLDQDRCYGCFEAEGTPLMGEGYLLKRAGLAALEIGYWFHAAAVGRGLATEMCQALVKVAFEHDQISRLDLACDVDNDRSAKMAERLGFTFEGRLRDRQLAPHHPRGDLLWYTLLATEYPNTDSKQLPIEPVDFLGRRLA